MAYSVVVAAPAEEDLERALACIAVILGAPAAATTALDDV